MSEARQLRLGRLPPTGAQSLRLAAFADTSGPPPYPASADYLAAGGWAMLGNDRYGDCVAVTWGNVTRLVTRAAGAETYPSLDAVLAVYRTQNAGFPQQDDGMVIQNLLDYLHGTGGPDGRKLVAFAKLDHTDPAEVKAAIAIFGSIWVGIDVTAANMAQFRQGAPWDHVPDSPLEGGHSVLVGGYDSDGIGGDERFITWAAETAFTDRFWAEQVEEAWVTIWPEHLSSAHFLANIDTAALADAYRELTGDTLPIPDPPPAPPATVDSYDQTLAQAALDWVRNHRHSGEAATVAVALRAWFEDKGLGHLLD